MTREFDELIETSDLAPEERRRLEGVHELLVAAGPPPELPAALREPPAPAAEVVSLDSRRRRSRRVLAGVIAAAVAVALFAGGYALGDRSDGKDVVRVMPLEGVAQQARAEVSLHEGDGGNWPMELTVTGLPRQEGRGYYELFVWRDGKPRYPCVGFKMQNGTTTVRFTVPYELEDDTQLRVTMVNAKNQWPGRVVMRTA